MVKAVGYLRTASEYKCISSDWFDMILYYMSPGAQWDDTFSGYESNKLSYDILTNGFLYFSILNKHYVPKFNYSFEKLSSQSCVWGHVLLWELKKKFQGF